MANAQVSYKNALGETSSDTASTPYGDADASYPVSNLKDPVFSKVWRFTVPSNNNDGSFAKFAFSLASPATSNFLALAAHNMGSGAQLRLRTGMARFDADFTTDNPFVHDLVFGGGTNGTRINEYGVQVTNVCPRYEHDRRYYENGFLKSEDLSDVNSWTVTGTRYADGRHLYLPTVTGAFGQTHGPLAQDTYEILARCRCKEGDGQLTMLIQGVTSFGAAFGSTKTVGSDWQWVTWTCTIPSSEPNTAFSRLVKPAGAAGGLFEFSCLQLRRGISGGKYRKTTTLRRYQRKGLIKEQGATNSVLRSQDYANVWTKGANVTIVSYMGGAPDGGAFSLHNVNCTAAGQGFSQVIPGIGGTSTRAFSVMFKRGSSCTSASIAINWFNGGTVGSVVCVFNPSTGAFISSTNSPLQAGVEDMGEGFYRAYVIGTGTDALNTQANLQITWNTTGTIFLYGSQFEANVVTTYIPTTTATVTRTVDTFTVEPTVWVPYVWNASEGTVYEETWVGAIPGDTTRGLGYMVAYSGVGGQTTNSIFSRVYEVGGGPSVVSDLFAFNSGSATVATTTTTLARNAAHRTAYRYRTNDVAFSVDGGAVVTDNNTPIATINTIDLCYSPGSTAFIRRITIWPWGMSNADLQTLTASGPSAIDYDSGWQNVFQMVQRGDIDAAWGKTYDIIDTFPARGVEWLRCELYDPAKTATTMTFDIGRAVMGKVSFQPAKNMDWAPSHGWQERTTSAQAFDGRKFFNERPKIRETAISFKNLTLAETDQAHDLQGVIGTSQEAVFLPDPDDLAKCQRYGFIGYLKELDRVTFPLFAIGNAAFQIEDKR